jgi:hypothetical protein
MHTINAMVYLFNPNNEDNVLNIGRYIQNERKRQIIDINTTVRIISDVYDVGRGNPTLYLGIIKDGVEFIHLNFHLCVRSWEDHPAGLLHISKDIYPKNKCTKKSPCAMIFMKQDLPDSIFFSIPSQYYHTDIEYPIYDDEIKKEMDVIITVLNRLFDEKNKRFYVGNNRPEPPLLVEPIEPIEPLSPRSLTQLIDEIPFCESAL